MKRIFTIILALIFFLPLPTRAEAAPDLALEAPSAILVHASGSVLWEQDAHRAAIPASVTKIMTMLLIMEGLDGGTLAPDEVVTGSEHARSMGGSQVFLDAGERMTVDEMLKCIAIASANDCSVAMAEHISGSEEAFAAGMNARAAALGMNDTAFVDASGLSEQNRTSAFDVALMAAELLRHEGILAYTTTWQDSIRGGAFGLDNKNRMLKTFDGCTGLKTGWIPASGYNIAASATRGDMSLIAVVMGGKTADSRNGDAAKLLNYGFANFASVSLTPDTPIMPVEVVLGKQPSVLCGLSDTAPQVYEKAKLRDVTKTLEMTGPLEAPVAAGTPVGQLVVRAGDAVITRVPIVTLETVERQSVWDIWLALLRGMTMRA